MTLSKSGHQPELNAEAEPLESCVEADAEKQLTEVMW